MNMFGDNLKFKSVIWDRNSAIVFLKMFTQNFMIAIKYHTHKVLYINYYYYIIIITTCITVLHWTPHSPDKKISLEMF